MVAAPWSFVAAQPAAEPPPVHIDAAVATPDRARQLSESARAALALFVEWLGPYPAPALQIRSAQWRAGASDSVPGMAEVAVRRIEIDRDPAAERRLIASIARHFWHDALAAPPEQRWLAEALARYFGARAIDIVLEGRQFWAARYFGGFVPFASRSLPLSPFGGHQRGHVMAFDDTTLLPPDSDAILVERATTALFTLERFIGWPALQQAVFAYRAETGGRGNDLDALARIVAEQRGGELSWFFEQAFLPARTFDYAVDDVTSTADGSRFAVRVSLRRMGDGVFGTGEASRGPSLPVAIRFADGTQAIDRWHGGLASLVLDYTAPAPAVMVSVDPDAMLLLDQDRRNNVYRVGDAPPTGVGRRATLAWIAWAENLMLTCLALV